MSNFHQNTWQKWCNGLQRMGLEDIVATLLEAGAPLHLAGAQLVYLGQPILSALFPNKELEALACLLEDPHHTAEFVNSLKEDKT